MALAVKYQQQAQKNIIFWQVISQIIQIITFGALVYALLGVLYTIGGVR